MQLLDRSKNTDLKGVVATVCAHYCPMLVVEATNPEHHGHYFQSLQVVQSRFGVLRASTDIACRLTKMLETLNSEEYMYELPKVFQSYLHGSFHEWVCLVIRGFPWNHELGRFTGEEAERFFGILIKLYVSVSQQSRLRRTYTLHRFITSWIAWKNATMHIFLADRLARVGQDWQKDLAALEQLGGMYRAELDASLLYWQVRRRNISQRSC